MTELRLSIISGDKHISVRIADADATLTAVSTSKSAFAAGAGELLEVVNAAAAAHNDTDKIELDPTNVLQVLGK
jgi:hypothetical protein